MRACCVLVALGEKFKAASDVCDVNSPESSCLAPFLGILVATTVKSVGGVTSGLFSLIRTYAGSLWYCLVS